ncbi:MAG: hypothetical protein LZF62_480259 [Nitrospira sp.]|nr:MAG: hypothetical protein LZF62_480259 [Nitrospira sp.]
MSLLRIGLGSYCYGFFRASAFEALINDMQPLPSQVVVERLGVIVTTVCKEPFISQPLSFMRPRCCSDAFS